MAAVTSVINAGSSALQQNPALVTDFREMGDASDGASVGYASHPVGVESPAIIAGYGNGHVGEGVGYLETFTEYDGPTIGGQLSVTEIGASRPWFPPAGGEPGLRGEFSLESYNTVSYSGTPSSFASTPASTYGGSPLGIPSGSFGGSPLGIPRGSYGSTFGNTFGSTVNGGTFGSTT